MADIHAVAEAIKQALPLFTRPDDVVEIRFLEVDGVREKKNAAWIVAGNVDKFARQIASTGMVSSTYFTPQVLKPELLGRRKEGFFAEVRKVKGVTTPLLTHDEDCTGVRFLLVDVDPVRPEERRSWS